MKKYIYIITNNINDKVYIGQAINVKQRFQSHCKPSSAIVDNDLVAKAIQKYGKEHFFVSILENNIENYNEREIYWIKTYNSIRPNGYNISSGGEEPPINKGTNHPESKLSDYDLKGLIYDLMYSDMSYRNLSGKYGIASTTIGCINNGNAYIQDNIKYPIRKSPNDYGKISNEKATEIVNLLKYTYLSYEEISRKYQVEARAISRINKGIYHRIANEIYPIRDFTNTNKKPLLSYENVSDIIELLINTDISIRKIAKNFNVETNIIIGIKSGTTKMYKRKGYIYPLRTNN